MHGASCWPLPHVLHLRHTVPLYHWPVTHAHDTAPTGELTHAASVPQFWRMMGLGHEQRQESTTARRVMLWGCHQKREISWLHVVFTWQASYS